LQGKTIKQYALERLFPGDADAERAWEELKTLMNMRVNEGLAGRLSTKTVGEILDEGDFRGSCLTAYILTAEAESDLRSVIRYTNTQWSAAQVGR
jgi:hypothetical protein